MEKLLETAWVGQQVGREDVSPAFAFTTILTRTKNNSLWLHALPSRLTKVVFPLVWLCWVGYCALMALPGESCAPAALGSCHLACWNLGVIPKHRALLGKRPSLWNCSGDSPSLCTVGLCWEWQPWWCLKHLVLKNRVCSQLNLWPGPVHSKSFDSIFSFLLVSVFFCSHSRVDYIRGSCLY